MTCRAPILRKRLILPTICAVALAMLASVRAQAQADESSFEQASGDIQQRLEAAVAELNALREQMKDEKLPLSRRLSELEQELAAARKEYQGTSRQLNNRQLEVANLKNEIERRRGEATYLSNLLDEYIRNFEAGLHIAELQRYERPLQDAKLAMENSTLSPQDRYTAQLALVDASIGRLEDALGGARFDGTAVDASGKVQNGTFVLIGPAAYFRSADGSVVGTVEQRLGSLVPSIVAFKDPLDAQDAAALVEGTGKTMPLDATLGNAAIMEMTQDTFMDHVKKGGPVMIPIFGLAGAALLVALYKWLAIVLTRKPSAKRLRMLLAAVAARDMNKAREAVGSIKGPTGKMLEAGVEHLGEPSELIEEVMYEQVLTARLKVQRLLPFIAICAAAAPLLGLLGTVTGIINTFKLITVFGTGDVKTLSGGISEALITTKFGLIVAIPALLVHAFLARKARGVVDQMEKAAVSFVNQVLKTPFPSTTDKPDPPKSEKPAPQTKPETGGPMLAVAGSAQLQPEPRVVDAEQEPSPDAPRA